MIRQIRRLKLTMPRRASLYRNAKRIEAKLKRRLGAVKHEELENRMNTMPDDELRVLLDAVLDELAIAKMRGPPDRLKYTNTRAKEIWQVA